MVFLAGWLAVSAATQAQTCFTGSDMDASTRTALVNTGQKYFNFASQGDVASLRQNAIPSLAANFAGIESAVIENKPALSGGSATPRSPFLLKAEGAKPLERAEFLCGVFGAQGQTANSAEFVIPNLPPGNYGIVTLDVAAQKPSTVTFVLQQQGTDWKLGGFFAKPSQVSGHDGNWFLQQARSYKAKGQNRIAWFYYLEARELLVPVSFMYTQSTDKAYDEMQTVKPSDLPPFDLSGAGKTYKVMDMFPVVVGSDLDLVVKYQSASVSDTGQTFQENMAVMKALLTKYPELRDAFAGIVARATEPSGKDYGSLMAMKDIK
ncbi:MAG: hypothetical protein DMG90_04560 [Acidobacteria bacterium]|nr:MAG: hypothetical protein DMG90_04560 [Acidobacteriota bacterium]